MFACSDFYLRLQLPLIIIHITCISLSLCQTSAPIHLTSVLGVLGTQETSCILISGLLERDTFDLFLPKFDKPWVIHLRKTCCYSTNICTWRPNTIYKNKSVYRHQALFWRHCLGLKKKKLPRQPRAIRREKHAPHTRGSSGPQPKQRESSFFLGPPLMIEFLLLLFFFLETSPAPPPPLPARPLAAATHSRPRERRLAAPPSSSQHKWVVPMQRRWCTARAPRAALGGV
jgi:hypothetical protein